MNSEDETITVTIPDRSDHGGFQEHLKKYTISNKCPKCGAKRAIKRWKDYSYDGSRKLFCDRWDNACNHYDLYEDVRIEAAKDDFDKLTKLVDQSRFELSRDLGREPLLSEITEHLESQGLIPPVYCEVKT